MNKFIRKISICAAAMLAVSFAHSENYEVVSNLTNALFTSADAVTMKPIDQILARQPSAALMADANCLYRYYYANNPTAITNLYLGRWSGTTDPGIYINDIAISDCNVTIKTEERFLILTNATLSIRAYQGSNTDYHVTNYYVNDYINNYSSWIYFYYVESCPNIVTEQECEPPAPWTTRGVYGPYCKSQMTNRIEQIKAHSGAIRKIVGYYDADGDGFATLTRVGVVHSADGDYLDERADGEYWMMNDVAIVEYTIPRQSYLNYVYGQEDAVNHYWQAIKAFYKVTLPTTPLKPWWKMPEYQ